jgi:hypothetical protein
MQSYFQDIPIECWWHDGKLATSMRPLCMFRAETNGCDTIVRAIDELIVAGPPSKRTLTFQRCQRPRVCTTVRLILSPESDDLRQMHIGREGEVATIEVTLAGIWQVREAVTAWRNGGEDFRVTPEGRRNELGSKDLASRELWFWGPRMTP